jgi:hypothetical protein
VTATLLGGKRVLQNDEEAARGLRELAEAGEQVFGAGSAPRVVAPQLRSGSWVFCGGGAALGLQALLHLSPGWILAALFVAGWALNEDERRRRLA